MVGLGKMLENVLLFSSTVGEFIIPLIFFAVLDFVSGFIKAYINKEISSRKMSNGAMRKIGILIAAAMVYELDSLMNAQGMLANMTKYWFIIMEAISVLENLQQAGVVLPEFLVKGLQGYKKTFESKGEVSIHTSSDFTDKE